MIAVVLGDFYFQENERLSDTLLHGLATVGEISAVTRIILSLEQAGVEDIFLLTAKEDTTLSREVAHLGITLLTSQAVTANELFWAGLRTAETRRKDILLVSEQTPLFRVSSVKALLEASLPAVVAGYQKTRGTLLFLGYSEVIYLLGLASTPTAQQVIDGVECLALDDVGIVIDSKKDKGYQEALSGHSLARLRPDIKVRVGREKLFLGPGTSQLLDEIESTGSVRQACTQMGISYSKGWNMITLMEQQLGELVVERQQGGKRGGHARLTPIGQEYQRRYLAFTHACQQEVERLFSQHFGDL